MFEADDFASDPYGFATNQAGHGLFVGAPLALILVPWAGPYLAPVIVAVAYLLLWEVLYQIVIRKSRNWGDALEDTSHVMGGAAVICGAMVDYWTAVACLGAQMVFVAIGFLRRWRL